MPGNPRNPGVGPSPVGVALAAARKRRGLTLRQLADRSGVSNPVISQIETGHTRSPRWDTIDKLAKALDMEIVLRSV